MILQTQRPVAMKDVLYTIPVLNLTLIFIPVVVVIGIMVKWMHPVKSTLVAIARMVVQLVLVGYLLTYIFETKYSWLILGILTIMALIASWISLRMVKTFRISLYKYAVASIFLAGSLSIIIVTQGVLRLNPWYAPQFMIPLAGMIFANSMNSVSLAAERFFAEKEGGSFYVEARRIAFKAALIPNVNSLFAVGLVSLPGMMTGQILSGVSPLIAVRYQIMVMCMVFGAAGISAATFLYLSKRVFVEPSTLQQSNKNQKVK